ncbi:unnamed protein product, partial [Allacma fusca]
MKLTNTSAMADYFNGVLQQQQAQQPVCSNYSVNVNQTSPEYK